MRLSKLKLAGFKSFVDPTTVHFPSDLTGVVGPNGCGKSNVVDAIKWVLGDQRARSLRGQEMTDVIFKGLLMMSMGAVLHVTGEMRGSELGGLYKKMPKTAILCMVGAASISAFPLFSGFVSKSMVVAAAIQEGHTVVWLALLFASAGVFHHAGIKIPFFAFFAHDSRYVDTAHEPPVNMLVAMTLGALLFCLSAAGIFLNLLDGIRVVRFPFLDISRDNPEVRFQPGEQFPAPR